MLQKSLNPARDFQSLAQYKFLVMKNFISQLLAGFGFILPFATIFFFASLPFLWLLLIFLASCALDFFLILPLALALSDDEQ